MTYYGLGLVQSTVNTEIGHDDYKLFNYSRGARENAEPILGCKSCLLGTSCDGRIETPAGALVLVPEPRTCQNETVLMVYIKHHPLIRALFDALDEAERNLPGVAIPGILRAKHGVRSSMLSGST